MIAPYLKGEGELIYELVEQANMDVKQVVKQHWGNRATEFDAKTNHGLHSETQHQAWLDVLYQLDRRSDPPNARHWLWDRLSYPLTRRARPQRHGNRPRSGMLELARQKAAAAGPNAEFRLGDAEELDDAD
jgi:hypothetical protein